MVVGRDLPRMVFNRKKSCLYPIVLLPDLRIVFLSLINGRSCGQVPQSGTPTKGQKRR
jgi:hypothetical protein